MNSKKFKPRTLIQTLELICHARGGNLLRNGKVNQSEIARLAGTRQANVSRWFSQEYHPKDENINRLAKAFKVTPAQIRGEQPINSIDEFSAITPEDAELIGLIPSLPDDLKDLIRSHIQLYQKMKSDS